MRMDYHYVRHELKNGPVCFQRVEPITLGEMIRVKRKILGLSQQELGIRCGYKPGVCARNAVAQWEADKRPVPLYKLRIASEVLQLPLDRLIPESR